MNMYSEDLPSDDMGYGIDTLVHRVLTKYDNQLVNFFVATTIHSPPSTVLQLSTPSTQRTVCLYYHYLISFATPASFKLERININRSHCN